MNEETWTSSAVRCVALFDHIETQKVLHEQPNPVMRLLIWSGDDNEHVLYEDRCMCSTHMFYLKRDRGV